MYSEFTLKRVKARREIRGFRRFSAKLEPVLKLIHGISFDYYTVEGVDLSNFVREARVWNQLIAKCNKLLLRRATP